MKHRLRKTDVALGIFLGIVAGLLLVASLAAIAAYFFPSLLIGSAPPRYM